MEAHEAKYTKLYQEQSCALWSDMATAEHPQVVYTLEHWQCMEPYRRMYLLRRQAFVYHRDYDNGKRVSDVVKILNFDDDDAAVRWAIPHIACEMAWIQGYEPGNLADGEPETITDADIVEMFPVSSDKEAE